jgi:hypothetical protein
MLEDHRNSTGEQEGEHARLKPLSSGIVSKHDHGIFSQFLVPGGRYLFTCSRYSLDLFDLGRAGRKSLETSVLVARQSFENYENYYIGFGVDFGVVGVKGDESRLRVGLLVFFGDLGHAECVYSYQ